MTNPEERPDGAPAEPTMAEPGPVADTEAADLFDELMSEPGPAQPPPGEERRAQYDDPIVLLLARGRGSSVRKRGAGTRRQAAEFDVPPKMFEAGKRAILAAVQDLQTHALRQRFERARYDFKPELQEAERDLRAAVQLSREGQEGTLSFSGIASYLIDQAFEAGGSFYGEEDRDSIEEAARKPPAEMQYLRGPDGELRAAGSYGTFATESDLALLRDAIFPAALEGVQGLSKALQAQATAPRSLPQYAAENLLKAGANPPRDGEGYQAYGNDYSKTDGPFRVIDIPYDLEGWRYEKLAAQVPPERFSKRPDRLQVELWRGGIPNEPSDVDPRTEIGGNAAGEHVVRVGYLEKSFGEPGNLYEADLRGTALAFEPDKSELLSIINTWRHELAHAIQDYLGKMLPQSQRAMADSKGQPLKGEPKIEDQQGFVYGGIPAGQPRQRSQRPDRHLQHALRDIEAYPNLISDLMEFERYRDRYDNDPRKYVEDSSRFQLIRENRPQVWKRLVRAFVNAAQSGRPADWLEMSGPSAQSEIYKRVLQQLDLALQLWDASLEDLEDSEVLKNLPSQKTAYEGELGQEVLDLVTVRGDADVDGLTAIHPSSFADPEHVAIEARKLDGDRWALFTYSADPVSLLKRGLEKVENSGISVETRYRPGTKLIEHVVESFEDLKVALQVLAQNAANRAKPHVEELRRRRDEIAEELTVIEEENVNRRPPDRTADLLPGGVADDRPDSDFAPDDLAQGMEIEAEHIADPKAQKEITKDHIVETRGEADEPGAGPQDDDSVYYDGLLELEADIQERLALLRKAAGEVPEQAPLAGLKSVIVVFPIEGDVGKAWPEVEEDQGPPHLTMAYVESGPSGGLSEEDAALVGGIVEATARDFGPRSVEFAPGVSWFTSDTSDAEVAHKKPIGLGASWLGDVARALRDRLQEAGYTLGHAGEFKPHATLGYAAQRGGVGLAEALRGQPIPEGAVKLAKLAVWARGPEGNRAPVEFPLEGADPDYDLVVTLPKGHLTHWAEHEDEIEDAIEGMYSAWHMGGHIPKDAKPGNRIYAIHDGKLIGYAPLHRIEKLPRGGFNLIRGPGALARTIDGECKGFQGVRYRWWPREAEKPYPEWRGAPVEEAHADLVTRAAEFSGVHAKRAMAAAAILANDGQSWDRIAGWLRKTVEAAEAGDAHRMASLQSEAPADRAAACLIEPELAGLLRPIEQCTYQRLMRLQASKG